MHKKKPETILSNVNIEINPHELIGIIGSAGSGKTTFLNAACGFERATSGTVMFNGLDLYKNFWHLTHLIGYVPQNDIIHNDLVLRRMLMYSAKTRLSNDLSADELNLIIDNVLDSLDLRKQQDQVIRTLSNGQRKRACIAVELLANPSIFFLDEPTSGLDPHIGNSIVNIMRSLAHDQGRTVLMVTHNLENIEICDNVAVFGMGGHLCYFGKPYEMQNYFGVNKAVSIYEKADEISSKWVKEWVA